MKNRSSLCLMALAIGLAFGAGYAARGPGHGSGAAAMDGEAGHERGGARSLPGEERRLADRSTGGSRGARHGEAGREQPPFAPGHAAAWLAALARQDCDDDLSKLQIAQACGRLDAAQAEELARECLRISNLVIHGDEATLKAFPDSSVADLVATQAIGRLTQLDPVQAFSLMHHGPDEGVDDGLLRIVFGAMARKDSAQAMSAALALPEEDQDAACEGVVKQMAKTDPQAALALLEQNSSTRYLINEVVKELAKTDPQAAIATAAKEMLAGNGTYVLRNLAQSGDEMGQQVADWAVSYAGPESTRIRAGVLEMMAGEDAGSARDFYAKIAASLPEEERGEAAAQVAQGLLNSGSGVAKAWVDSLGEGPVKEAAMRSLVTTALGRADLGMISRNNIDAVLGAGGPTRTNADFIASVDGTSISGITGPTPTNVANMFATVVHSGPLNYLGDAANWIGEMAPSDLKADLTANLVMRLQDSDGATALKWIDTLPEGDRKETLKRETELKMQLKELKQSQVPAGAFIGGR